MTTSLPPTTSYCLLQGQLQVLPKRRGSGERLRGAELWELAGGTWEQDAEVGWRLSPVVGHEEPEVTDVGGIFGKDDVASELAGGEPEGEVGGLAELELGVDAGGKGASWERDPWPSRACLPAPFCPKAWNPHRDGQTLGGAEGWAGGREVCGAGRGQAHKVLPYLQGPASLRLPWKRS